MLIFNGESYDTTPDGFVSYSYLEKPSFRLVSRQRAARPAGTWVRGVTIHTTGGINPQPIRTGLGVGGGAQANVDYWNRASRSASAHLLVDRDGTVAQTADLLAEQTWHATSVNPVTVGIEVVQGPDGSLYQGQIDTVVRLVNLLTRKLGVQRQIPADYRGDPIERLHAGARDFVGVFGHRDQTSDRGRGDPGDAIMQALLAAGYEQYDLGVNADKAAWAARQAALGLTPDGVPGPSTVQALKSAGKPNGLWVESAITGASTASVVLYALVLGGLSWATWWFVRRNTG